MQVAKNKRPEKIQIKCYHCGENCAEETAQSNDKSFCCDGCKLVYELLNENNLCTYYALNDSPGLSLKKTNSGRFDYLDDNTVKRKLLKFSDGKQNRVTFFIPKMHCSSCIWLLENLYKLNDGIKGCTVNFLKKEASIIYNEDVKLSTIVSLLAVIGYEPLISLNDLEDKKPRKVDKTRIIKIGIAGFCFGNIMMLSFPEYFSLGNFYEQNNLKSFFGGLNLFLSLPVFFYSASDFFISSWKGIRQRFLNIDIPIAFAIVVAFIRSIYEILTGTGAGYLDSMSGIVFFMLLGRYFQNITYDSLSFERDYKSFFPISVTILKEEKESSVPVSDLKKGDVIIIRNSELIPADSILISDQTYIDYSFVTGESRPVKVTAGNLIYAGGRQLHGAVELIVEKEVSQSYLTGLWNKEFKNGNEEPVSSIHRVSRYFTYVVFLISFTSFGYWLMMGDPGKGLNALTSVLIIACPCALLLSATFTNGNMIRIFGRNNFYIKNPKIIERLANADTIVFDKTGTITHGAAINFKGSITEEETKMAASLASGSTHPLSRKIYEQYSINGKLNVKNFEEFPGHGIKGMIDGKSVIMGSSYFVVGKNLSSKHQSSMVYLMIDGVFKGYFLIDNAYRSGLASLISDLKQRYAIKLLSGDNDSEKELLTQLLQTNDLLFEQKPEDKTNYIKSLKESGHTVIMIGDGLNDSGALLSSNVGIAISDDTNNFSPSCDAILNGASFGKLDNLLSFARSGRKLILASFIISIVYNLVGVFFAVQGSLSPVIAAILMPASSISIILFTTVASSLIARKKNLN